MTKQSELSRALCNWIDRWEKEHPGATIMEVLEALEDVRDVLTEGMLRMPQR